MTKKQPKEWYKKTWVWIVGVIVLLFFIGAAGGDQKSSTTTKPKPAAPAKEAPAPAPEAKAAISESDAEQYCQDAGLLGKYVDMSRISVVNVSSYNVQYFDTGNKDSSGQTIMMLSWNGKRDGQKVLFQCEISGTKDNIQLQSLRMAGIDLYTR